MDVRSATDSGVHGMLLSLVLSNSLSADVTLCASWESSSVIVSVGLQGSCIFFCILTPDPNRLAHRRGSPTTIQLYQDYYSASIGYSYVF
jgi:hypothetical protein